MEPILVVKNGSHLPPPQQPTCLPPNKGPFRFRKSNHRTQPLEFSGDQFVSSFQNWQRRVSKNRGTLQGTNISPKNGILKMIFLFPRWDMLIPWRVPQKIAKNPMVYSGEIPIKKGCFWEENPQFSENVSQWRSDRPLTKKITTAPPHPSWRRSLLDYPLTPNSQPFFLMDGNSDFQPFFYIKIWWKSSNWNNHL